MGSGLSMIQYENMSAVHAGTKKWNKIIRAAAHHQHADKELHSSINTTTASSNDKNYNNLMQVHFAVVVWCVNQKKF